MNKIIENAIRHCIDHNLRKLNSKEYLEKTMEDNGIKAEWKNNQEFLLVNSNYGYEIRFNKGGICRGYTGKDFNRTQELEEEYEHGYDY